MSTSANTDYTESKTCVTYTDYHKEPIEYFNINDWVAFRAEENKRYKNVLDFLIENKVCE